MRQEQLALTVPHEGGPARPGLALHVRLDGEDRPRIPADGDLEVVVPEGVEVVLSYRDDLDACVGGVLCLVPVEGVALSTADGTPSISRVVRAEPADDDADTDAAADDDAADPDGDAAP